MAIAEFKNKYLVLKIEDIETHLSSNDRAEFAYLIGKIDAGRLKLNKPINTYIICNMDEPYAESIKQTILEGEDAKK